MSSITFKSVSKKFGSIQALDNLSFFVNHGSTGILGPNGSGKTTMMKILTGLLRPDSGEVLVNDIEVIKEPKKAMKFVGSLIEQPEFYTYLTGYETLEFACRIRGLSKIDTLTEIQRVSKLTGCNTYLDRRTGGYSRGMKQRLGLSLALAGDPDILVLDEPTFGLDPKGMKELGSLILDLRKVKTILFSTHIISEAKELCDRVIIMENGIQKYDSMDDKANETISISVSGRISNIPDLSKFGSYSFKENLILISKTDGVENSDIVELLVKNGIKIQTVESYNNIEGKYLSVVEHAS